MRFFRIAHVATDWESSKPAPSLNGHPLYVHRAGQGAGRFDLPEYYLGLYLARQPQAAVGEILQHLATWPATEISRARTVDRESFTRCLVELETDRQFLDLDDPAVLNRIGWRPSDVVNKDRAKTQELAMDQWLRRRDTGVGGFIWWSSCHPAWTVAMAWSEPLDPRYADITVESVDALHRDHPAILVAARTLKRPIT